MKELINLNSYPIKTTLSLLLKDKTTKKNIIWATDSYKDFGESYFDDKQITIEAISGLSPIMLQPRIMKALAEQQERTRAHAEVFTPAWICNKMNNYCDEEWFGEKNVFNIEENQEWKTKKDKILFNKNLSWKDYVMSRRLEITCGEAPYIVSRYDTSTGESIEINNRIGVLDRKLRVVGENALSEEEWLEWATKAFQSVYGYEYQGDNLLVGRLNLILTFDDYVNQYLKRSPSTSELKKIANIISWNFWQMDGLTGTVPLGVPKEEEYQCSLFGFFDEAEAKEQETPKCRIYDWVANKSLGYEELKRRNI